MTIAMKRSTLMRLWLAISATQIVHANVPVSDFTKISQGTIERIESPKNVMALRAIVTSATKPIAIAGGKYSMGGQVWCQDGIMVDMKHINAITAFDPEQKLITVQAGARWRDVQHFLLKHGLTIAVMQSYNDFSIGGSLSVNVHGRDPRGQLVTTVDSITVMLADGSLVKASRTEHSDLFSAVIGGYGACGIIVDATLQLEDNYKIKRVMTTIPVKNFTQFFRHGIARDARIAHFNANIYGPSFDKVVSFAWYKTDEPLTVEDLSRPYDYKPGMAAAVTAAALEYAVSEYDLAQRIRFLLEDKVTRNSEYVVWRSYEMSHTVKSLARGSGTVSKILQEYFIPVAHFETFVSSMKHIFQDYDVKIMNVSIRHVPANTQSYLSYAPVESFAFVCYISVDNTPEGFEYMRTWTQELINAAGQVHGTYYLPYHLCATPEQFARAYPRYEEFLAVKHTYDPTHTFQNSLTRQWAR